tara:strand:- start:1325 stop:1576 length:252 start_codon:yes stop_codon:yes gene_type:complete
MLVVFEFQLRNDFLVVRDKDHLLKLALDTVLILLILLLRSINGYEVLLSRGIQLIVLLVYVMYLFKNVHHRYCNKDFPVVLDM